MSASVLVNPELIFPPLEPRDSRVVQAIEQIVAAINANTTSIATNSPLLISGGLTGIPADSAYWQYIFPVDAVLPADLAGSFVKPPIHAPSAETVLTIQRVSPNDTPPDTAKDLGTLTYAQTTGAVTIDFEDDQSFAAGDRLFVVNQGDNDASAGDFGWTFVATRS